MNEDADDDAPQSCYQHPERTRALPCRMCGKVVCHECRVSHYAGTLPIPVCRKCDARMMRRRKLRRLSSGSGGLVLVVLVLGVLYFGTGLTGRGGAPGVDEGPPRIRDVKGVAARALAGAQVALAPAGQPATVVAVEFTSTFGRIPIKSSPRGRPGRDGAPSADQVAGLDPRVGFWQVSTLDDELPVAQAWIAGPGDLARLRRAARRSAGRGAAARYQLPPLADRGAIAPVLEPGGKPVLVMLIVTARDYDSGAPPAPGAIVWLRYHHFSSPLRGKRFRARLGPVAPSER